MEWIKCKEFKDLPLGHWLVRVDDKRNPFQVAYVNENSRGSKVAVVGNYFSYDSSPLIEYKAID